MSSRYRLGEPAIRRRHTFKYTVLVLLIMTTAVIAWLYLDTRPGTQIITGNTPTHQSTVGVSTTPMKQINEPLFSLRLPRDYQEVSRTVTPHRITWQSGDPKTTARSLQLYIDTIPTNLAVNRLLPVHSSGNQITAGEVSDNCANFVGPVKMTPQLVSQAKPTPAKWQGIGFICDLPNYLREVVATGTDEGTGPGLLVPGSSGGHRYLFVYTDHTSQPNFMLLRDIVNSFSAK